MTVLDYEKLYNSYYLQVYSYVMTIVKSRSVAEVVTQNTFFKAMTARRSYEGKASELTWLCSIAKNLAIDECRKNSKFAELDEDTLFYLASRGISREQAEDMMARAGIERLKSLIADEAFITMIDQELGGDGI